MKLNIALDPTSSFKKSDILVHCEKSVLTLYQVKIWFVCSSVLHGNTIFSPSVTAIRVAQSIERKNIQLEVSLSITNDKSS